eukprot:4596528-Pyramimonas_sp.AAC.1
MQRGVFKGYEGGLEGQARHLDHGGRPGEMLPAHTPAVGSNPPHPSDGISASTYGAQCDYARGTNTKRARRDNHDGRYASMTKYGCCQPCPLSGHHSTLHPLDKILILISNGCKVGQYEYTTA